MSYNRDRVRKEKRLEKLEERLADGTLTHDDILESNKIKLKIRRGILPRYYFAKDDKGKLERDAKGHLTWRTISTYKELTKC